MRCIRDAETTRALPFSFGCLPCSRHHMAHLFFSAPSLPLAYRNLFIICKRVHILLSLAHPTFTYSDPTNTRTRPWRRTTMRCQHSEEESGSCRNKLSQRSTSGSDESLHRIGLLGYRGASSGLLSESRRAHARRRMGRVSKLQGCSRKAQGHGKRKREPCQLF
jgi:hypothetical protein